MNLNSQRETIFDTISCVHLNIKRIFLRNNLFGKLVSLQTRSVLFYYDDIEESFMIKCN